MSVEQNKDLISRYFKESNAIQGDAGRLSALTRKYVDPGSIFHFAAGDMTVEQGAQFFANFFKGFPDMTWAVDDMVAEDDKVVVRCTWSGTQQGEWMGAAPTGKKYVQPEMVIYRIAGSKITEAWTVNDVMKPA